MTETAADADTLEQARTTTRRGKTAIPAAQTALGVAGVVGRPHEDHAGRWAIIQDGQRSNRAAEQSTRPLLKGLHDTPLCLTLFLLSDIVNTSRQVIHGIGIDDLLGCAAAQKRGQAVEEALADDRGAEHYWLLVGDSVAPGAFENNRG